MPDTGTPGGSDLVMLLDQVGSTLTPRQLDDFMVACARLVGPRLSDARSRRGLDIAERYARGEASRRDLEGAAPAVDDALAECVRRGTDASAALMQAIAEGTETEQLHRATWEPFAEAATAAVVAGLLSALRGLKPLAGAGEPRLPAGAAGWEAEATSRMSELARAATEGRLPAGVAAAGGLALLVAVSEAYWVMLTPGFLSSGIDPGVVGRRAFNEQLGRVCELLQRAGPV